MKIIRASKEQKNLMFTCPECGNKTACCVDHEVHIPLDVDYHDRFVCEECGAELYAEPQYNGKIKFKVGMDRIESASIPTKDIELVANAAADVYDEDDLAKVISSLKLIDEGIWRKAQSDWASGEYSPAAIGLIISDRLYNKYLSKFIDSCDGINCDTKVDPEYEEYEDEIKEIGQEFTSENTSINSSKLPAIFKMVSFDPGTVNIDYGGGRFDNVAEYLTQFDVVNLVYDPYNRSQEHNAEVIRTVREHGGADTATCSNVLNVIKEPEVRLNVLNNIRKLVKPGGTVYITVYEGTGKSNEGPTKSGYQLNRKTADYMDEVQQVFPDAVRKGKLIVAHVDGSVKSAVELIDPDDLADMESVVEASKEVNIDSIKDRIYKAAKKVMLSPEFGFDEEDVDEYLVVEVTPGEEATCIQVRAEVSYSGLEELAEVLNPIVEKYDPEAYFDPVTFGITEAYIRNNPVGSCDQVSVESANYGGAFDIEPDQFFTKEDIVEFASNVAERLSEQIGINIDIEDVYMADPNMLHIELTDGDVTYESDVSIDMRRIRRPSDINKYLAAVVDSMKSQYDEYYVDSSTSTSNIMAYDDENDVKEYLTFKIDDVIVVDEDGNFDFEDPDNRPWSTPDDGKYWTSEAYPEVELDDATGVEEKCGEVLASRIPGDAGRYHIEAEVTLCYIVSGIVVDITDHWVDEKYGEDYEADIYTDDAQADFDFKSSTVDSFTFNKA